MRHVIRGVKRRDLRRDLKMEGKSETQNRYGI